MNQRIKGEDPFVEAVMLPSESQYSPSTHSSLSANIYLPWSLVSFEDLTYAAPSIMGFLGGSSWIAFVVLCCGDPVVLDL